MSRLNNRDMINKMSSLIKLLKSNSIITSSYYKYKYKSPPLHSLALIIVTCLLMPGFHRETRHHHHHQQVAWGQRVTSEMTPTFDLPQEGRAEHMMRSQQPNTIELLTNLLQSYRGSPSLNANQNLFNQNQRVNTNQQQQQPSLQVSTPMNPFLTNQLAGVQGQFPNPQQPSRRITLPANNLNRNQNQVLFSQQASSSPAPYLTLNRLNNQLGNQFNPNINMASPTNRQPFLSNSNSNNNNNNNNNNNSNGNLNPNQLPFGSRQPQLPPRGLQMPQNNGRPQQGIPIAPPRGIPLPPAAAVQPPGQVPKPTGGFAPSGPPPSPQNNNQNAMVLIQSPLQTTTSTSLAPADDISTSAATITTTSSSQNSIRDRDQRPLPPVTTTESNSQPQPPPQSSLSNNQFSLQVPSTTTTTTTTTTSTASSSAVSSPTSGSDDSNVTVTTIESSNSGDSSLAEGTSWSPVEAGRGGQQMTSQSQGRPKVTLAPSPDIVTVPPGYNPDAPNNSQPEIYDIPVSANMGGSGSTGGSGPKISVVALDSLAATSSLESVASSMEDEASTQGPSTMSSTVSSIESLSPSIATHSLPIPFVAPTAVTTITWSPSLTEMPSSSVISSSSRTPFTNYLQPTRVQQPEISSSTRQMSPQQTAIASYPTTTTGSQQAEKPSSSTSSPPPIPNRIRDNSLLNDEPVKAEASQDQSAMGVVYGKPQTRDSKPTAPPSNDSQPPSGRPFIKPAPIDSQVRPYLSGANNGANSSPGSLLKSNHHSPFKPSKPLNGNGRDQSPLSVGSGFTITTSGNQTMPTGDIQDYVAGQPPPVFGQSSSGTSGSHISGSFQVNGGEPHEPTISAQGGQDPATFDLSAQDSSPPSKPHHLPSPPVNEPSPPSSGIVSNQTTNGVAPTVPRVRRPTFKPKPAEPPIRIDSCIVGDENSCDQSHNERCVTEYGISSCHCKPGYARLSQLRGYCAPVSLMQLTLRIERLSDDRKLAFNHTLENPNTEEYQYMEFETIQAVAGAFQQTSLAKQFMGAKVNKFFKSDGRVWANVSVNLEANNVTKSNRISQIVDGELKKIVIGGPAVRSTPIRPLGESTIMLDGTKESVSRLVDINECANPDLNDCSKQATCSNEFGGFQCKCLPGYEDKHSGEVDKSKHGRVCLGCSPAYCSNRGECSIIDGQKQCKCRSNFIGSRCDIDSEVMAVAIGGSLVGVMILIVTFWCLFVFNRRWKREQQKMDAMSATSGLTYNYVNSSNNSLMSPQRIIGGIHRVTGGGGGGGGGHPGNGYAQRFGASHIGNGVSGRQSYATDQQAIIGSTSSGSSAASQPIGCNPYAPIASGYGQYEDASGLLVAPASTGSSEQTSPSGQSYRGGHMVAGTAYTLSGHHHHNHSHHHLQQQQQHQHSLLHAGALLHGKSNPQLSQFHPAAAVAAIHQDYRTMQQQQCAAGNLYADNRWHRTMQQQESAAGKQAALIGYYLQQQQHQQQLYASPQRELCIDTEHVTGRSRRQQGRGGGGGNPHTLRSRSQGPRPGGQSARNSSTIYGGPIDYEHERPI